MHRTKIFGALGIVLLLSSSAAFANKQKSVDVFKEFNLKISKLEKAVGAEKNKDKRYEIFLKHYRELSDLRAKHPRQEEMNEINMSLFMDSLSYLPEKKDFKSEKCMEYKNKVREMMKAYDPEKKEPFVEKAFGVVDLICK